MIRTTATTLVQSTSRLMNTSIHSSNIRTRTLSLVKNTQQQPIIVVSTYKRNFPTNHCRYLSTPAAPQPAETKSETNTTSTGPPPLVWMTHRLTKEQIEKVDRIFHKILWLDIFETSMLMNLINEKLGRVKLTPKQKKALQRQMDARVDARNGAAGAALSSASEEKLEEVEKPKLVDLKLVGYDEKAKIKVIKEIRAIVDGLGLKEAKELVEGAPKTIRKDLTAEVADELKAKLEAIGAKIEIVVK